MQTEQWESALGLGGMGDAVMSDQVPSAATYLPRGSFSATDISSAPSPAHSAHQYDWRSNASSPPLSPGSTATSTDFQSFFNALNSPANSNPALSNRSVTSPLHETYSPQFNPNTFGIGSPIATPVADTSGINWSILQPRQQQALAPAPTPRISRLIPGEGPVHGGIEVTVLGENFIPDLVCVFGDSAAVPTHFWSSNTLVCVLPPSANPGPVVVGIKGVPLTVESGTGLQLFTYKDDSDRSLLELALQVVGLKMTGRLEDASAVAMRIVGNGNNTNGASPHGSRNPSPSANGAGGPTDTEGLFSRMNAATASVYSSPAPSRPSSRAHSRRASIVTLANGSSSPNTSTATLPLPYTGPGGETRNFEGTVIKFLSLLDLDPSLIPGSAPSLPLAQPPISHSNAQEHTLLHLATVLGFHRLVQFLLARNVDIDSPDRNGFTALHFAALYGRVAICRQLIDAGAHPAMRNLAGKTPLDIAEDRDDVDVAEILQRARPSFLHRPSNSTSPATTPRSSSLHHLVGLSNLPRSMPMPRPPPMLPRSTSHSRSSRGSPVSSYSSELFSEEEDDSGSFSDRVSDEEDGGDYYSSDDETDSEGSFDSSEESSSDGSDDDGDEFGRRSASRRASRSASMVSLHYLLEAEEDVRAAAEWGVPNATPVPSACEFLSLLLALSIADIYYPLQL